MEGISRSVEGKRISGRFAGYGRHLAFSGVVYGLGMFLPGIFRVGITYWIYKEKRHDNNDNSPDSIAEID